MSAQRHIDQLAKWAGYHGMTPPTGEVVDAFAQAMADNQYGVEETWDAFCWFRDGFNAAGAKCTPPSESTAINATQQGSVSPRSQGGDTAARENVAACPAGVAPSAGTATSDAIGTRINHETEPHCCGCWVISYDSKGLNAICNECGEIRNLVALLADPVDVDRSAAVNLARNYVNDPTMRRITDRGIQSLAEAVMRMDAALSTPSASTATSEAPQTTVSTPGLYSREDQLTELLWRLYEGIYGHRKAEGIDPFTTAVGGALEIAKAWRERTA